MVNDSGERDMTGVGSIRVECATGERDVLHENGLCLLQLLVIPQRKCVPTSL